MVCLYLHWLNYNLRQAWVYQTIVSLIFLLPFQYLEYTLGQDILIFIARTYVIFQPWPFHFGNKIITLLQQLKMLLLLSL